MKIHLVITFSFLAFFSCKKENLIKKQFTKNATQIVYDQKTWYELRKRDENLKVEVIDTVCINQRKRAKSDIDKGKLTYFYYMGMVKIFRSNREMAELLSKFNIGIDSTHTTCFRPALGFEYYCYENEMRIAIDKKYGNNFIDSLRFQAEKKYVLKNPNKIYKFEDCDTIARYPRATNYKEHFDNYELDYFKNFNYPKGYIYKNEKFYSYTTADFILHKDGSITNIVIETSFQNPNNEKFRKLFDKRMSDFIKKTKWIPARSAGIIVNSIMEISITYK